MANSYCTNPTTVASCPAHTSSPAGSSSLLQCRCNQGFRCAYTKRITATVTLNSTVASFNNDTNGVKTAFIAGVAAAAGVAPSQVTINGVTPKAGGRRLLSAGSFIEVRTSVEGAERLHRLDHHLSKHSLTLHQGHVWEESHSVLATPEGRRPMVPT